MLLERICIGFLVPPAGKSTHISVNKRIIYRNLTWCLAHSRLAIMDECLAESRKTLVYKHLFIHSPIDGHWIISSLGLLWTLLYKFGCIFYFSWVNAQE